MTERPATVDFAADTQLDRIADEISDRISRGETIDVEEYAARHPQLADVIRGLFPALAALAEPPQPAFRDGDHHEPPSRMIGDFRLIRQIGRGGMGIVYEAEQISLQRRVALKILPFAAVLDPRQLQRFKIEAQAAAGLHHPHIVPVHSVGTDRGVHYYAMQFVDGQDLATILKQMRLNMVKGRIADVPAATRVDDAPSIGKSADCDMVLDPRAGKTAFDAVGDSAAAKTETPAGDTHRLHRFTTNSLSDKHHRFRTIAQLGIQAADALEYAHQRGIVHRDIKPSNLLIDGEGVLWVTDFGLAQMESESGLTMTGDLIGTLQYMSPEQALGQRGLVDQRTDVYALGVTLYELLTCQPMLPAADKAVLIKKIAYEDPPLPSSINRAIPSDLETIVLKAIAKEPAARYASAAALAEDLRHFLALRPIRAKRPGVWDRCAKWSRRNHILVASLAVILLIAVVALSASTFLVAHAYDAESHQRQIAEAQSKRADINLTLALQAVNDMLTEVASDEIVNVPQMETVRRALMQKAVNFLEQLLHDQGDVPVVRYEAAKAYAQITEIYNDLGNFEQAEVTSNRAIAMLQELIAAEPMNVAYRETLTEVYNHLTTSFFQRRPTLINDALATCELQLQETKKLTEDFPNELRFRRRLAEVYTDLGNAYWDARNHKQSEIYLRNAVDIWDELIAAHPEMAGSLEEAHCRQWYGWMLLRTSRYDAAEPKMVFANHVYEQFVQQHPDNAKIRGLLAHSRFGLGELYFRRGDFVKSAEFVRKATQLREALVEEFPNVYEYQRRLLICYQYLISTLGKEQRFEEAAAVIEKLKVLQQNAHDQFPQFATAPGVMAWAEQELAEYLYEADRLPDARQHYASALHYFQQTVAEYSDQFRPLHWLSWFHVTCPVEDLRDPQQGLAMAKRTVEMAPDNADALCVLGEAEFRCGDFDAAVRHLLRTTEICDNDPYATAQYVLAMIREEQGSPDEAQQRFRDAAKWSAAHSPTDMYVQRLHDEAAGLLHISRAD